AFAVRRHDVERTPMDPKNMAHRIRDALGTRHSPETAPCREPPPVADHQLVRRIGAGSYGEVWLARSVTGQWHAVKVIVRAAFASDRPFEREFRGIVAFEPISRSHAGLVHVLHVGRDEAGGSFHYVMELADAAGGEGEKRGKGENSANAPAPSAPLA